MSALLFGAKRGEGRGTLFPWSDGHHQHSLPLDLASLPNPFSHHIEVTYPPPPATLSRSILTIASDSAHDHQPFFSVVTLISL